MYEPTKEVQNGMPVYCKKNDPDTWIELVHGAEGWGWYLKAVANKGPDSSVCFTYYSCEGSDCQLPVDCLKDWFTNTVDGFKAQSSIKLSFVGGAEQPGDIVELLREEKWKSLHD